MYQDRFITDFKTVEFQASFKLYFAELGIEVRDWDALFDEMNHDPNGENLAYVRFDETDEVVGFIQFQIFSWKSWFFEKKAGFVREFWIAPKFRHAGHGRALLEKTERFFAERGICEVILTTDTAPEFYQRLGYRKRSEIEARNHDEVFAKEIK